MHEQEILEIVTIVLSGIVGAVVLWMAGRKLSSRLPFIAAVIWLAGAALAIFALRIGPASHIDQVVSASTVVVTVVLRACAVLLMAAVLPARRRS